MENLINAAGYKQVENLFLKKRHYYEDTIHVLNPKSKYWRFV